MKLKLKDNIFRERNRQVCRRRQAADERLPQSGH